MKRAIIVALLCLNVALLAAVAIRSTPKAPAQAYRGGTDYLLITSKLGENWDGVFIIDMGKRRMQAWKFDQTSKKLVALRGSRDLKSDFRRAE